jgi:hypothetical protein
MEVVADKLPSVRTLLERWKWLRPRGKPAYEPFLVSQQEITTQGLSRDKRRDETEDNQETRPSKLEIETGKPLYQAFLSSERQNKTIIVNTRDKTTGGQLAIKHEKTKQERDKTKETRNKHGKAFISSCCRTVH